MHNKSKFLLFSLSLLFFTLTFSRVYAATPVLSLVSQGDGDSIQVNVIGDSNQSVLFYYYKTGYGQQVASLGSTNSSGTFSLVLSSAQYGISSNSIVYVTTGGVNGSQSNNAVWPTVTGVSSSNMVSLSQTGVVLAVGQSNTITASNLNSSTLYLYSNSNPVIANFSISNNQITIYGNSYGSTTGTFCLVNNTSNCASVYVTVQSSGAQTLSFSQTSVSLSYGQTVYIDVSGGSGYYKITSNTSQSPNTVSATISGSKLSLTTTGTTGTSSITVCTTDMNSCGIVNVSIGSVSSTTNVSFSQSSPTVVVGQSLNISIYGPSSTLFYVSSNSNPSIVQVNLSGSALTLVGIASGTSSVVVCASSSNCSTLNVTVNYDYTYNGVLTLSQNTAVLNVGQSLNITISGGTMPYKILTDGSSAVQSTLNNNIVTVLGLKTGSSMINVCSNAGGCLTLSVSVSNSYVLPSGCTTSSGYSSTTGLACDGSSLSTTSTTSSNSSSSQKYVFTKSLKIGSSGTEVKELQKKLKQFGFFSGTTDGKFGSATQKAVKAFQKSKKLSQVGSVGPATRALLNK